MNLLPQHGRVYGALLPQGLRLYVCGSAFQVQMLYATFFNFMFFTHADFSPLRPV